MLSTKGLHFSGGKKNHYKNSLVGWFAFVSISPSLSHITTRVCFAVLLFLGAQINSPLLGVLKSVFSTFFLCLCPFLLWVIFILKKKRWWSVLQYETTLPRHGIGSGSVRFFCPGLALHWVNPCLSQGDASIYSPQNWKQWPDRSNAFTCGGSM